MPPDESIPPPAPPHRRRPRYRGKNPRRFDEKYKEHDPVRYAADVEKILQSGKTPAGMHRPIMVAEILEVLAPKPGDAAVDCTLGYGGHARAILERIQPDGKLIGLDVDPIELPRTEQRLRDGGFGAEAFIAVRSNFAGLPQVLAKEQLDSVDLILADLGVSSMQLDDPARGFTFKVDGPLDMRMNPNRGESAAQLLARSAGQKLAVLLVENSDEPQADVIANAIKQCAGPLATTRQLADLIRRALTATQRRVAKEETDAAVRRTFQALRVAVNDEFSALESFLRNLPACLKPGGRVAVLTFHSGEDRRVKKAFQAGERDGAFSAVADEVIRASSEELRMNPRASSAKLRWAVRAKE